MMKHRFIVNRERPEWFDLLRAPFQDESETEILWDRRIGERRLAQRRRVARPSDRDRRFFERRGAMPDSWAVPGFVFVAGHHTLGESGVGLSAGERGHRLGAGAHHATGQIRAERMLGRGRA